MRKLVPGVGSGEVVGMAGGTISSGAGVAGIAAATPGPQTVSPDTTKTLVDKYRSSTAVGRATGVLPLSVIFPAFGSSVYLVSQLTSENQSPTAELNYQQDKKGAAR